MTVPSSDTTQASVTDIAELCFTARALAQTHPMTEAAHRYRQHRFEMERDRQPVTELADWAGTALMVGYCLRRAEEQAVGLGPVAPVTSGDGLAGIEAEATAVGEALGGQDPDSATLLPAGTAVAALNRIIATELEKRREHLREQLDEASWSELEDYVAWWVVHGYGVRAAEAGLS